MNPNAATSEAESYGLLEIPGLVGSLAWTGVEQLLWALLLFGILLFVFDKRMSFASLLNLVRWYPLLDAAADHAAR